MKNLRLHSPVYFGVILLMYLTLESVPIPDEFLDGPFNQPGNTGDASGIVPALLLSGDESGLITYWDEDSNEYVTYDQFNEQFLAVAKFEVPSKENDGGTIFIVNGAVVAHTPLSEEGLRIQKTQGCIACHDM